MASATSTSACAQACIWALPSMQLTGACLSHSSSVLPWHSAPLLPFILPSAVWLGCASPFSEFHFSCSWDAVVFCRASLDRDLLADLQVDFFARSLQSFIACKARPVLLSDPRTERSGLTPKYLPLPQPTSANTPSRGRESRNSFTCRLYHSRYRYSVLCSSCLLCTILVMTFDLINWLSNAVPSDKDNDSLLH